MPRFYVVTRRTEMRIYELEAADHEAAEELALSGHDLPAKVEKLDEFVQSVRDAP